MLLTKNDTSLSIYTYTAISKHTVFVLVNYLLEVVQTSTYICHKFATFFIYLRSPVHAQRIGLSSFIDAPSFSWHRAITSMESHPPVQIYLPLTICIEHSPTNYIVLTTYNVAQIHPDSKVHGANMGPTWVLSAPDGPHVGPMNLAIKAGPEGVVYIFRFCLRVCIQRVRCCGIYRHKYDTFQWRLLVNERLYKTADSQSKKTRILCAVYVCVFCVCSIVTIQVLPGCTLTLCVLSSLSLLTGGNWSRFDTILGDIFFLSSDKKNHLNIDVRLIY